MYFLTIKLDETSQNWMVCFNIAEMKQQFFQTVLYLFIETREIYAAMLYVNKLYQKISKKYYNTLLRKNGSVGPLPTL